MSGKSIISKEIFQNAINAIELGIEDYLMRDDDQRRLHSSVRNLFAGILLLFKSKLAQLSPNDNEALLKEKVVPIIDSNGSLQWIGEGRRTVDFYDIKTRLTSLNISVDWKCLEELQKYRNNIEHYFDVNDTKASVIEELIAKSFVVIKDFIEKTMSVDPKACFSDSIWDTFLQAEANYGFDIKKKEEYFQQYNWFSNEIRDLFFEHKCSSCSSDYIRILQSQNGSKEAKDSVFECCVCGQKLSYEEFAREIIDDFLYSYDIVIDLGRDLIGFCPSCLEESYWADGNICLLCGEEGPFYCSRCDVPVPIEELPEYAESGLCGYCAHMAEKLFEEDD